MRYLVAKIVSHGAIMTISPTSATASQSHHGPPHAQQVPAGEGLVSFDRVEADGPRELLLRLKIEDGEFLVVFLRIRIRGRGDLRDAHRLPFVAGVVDEGEVALLHRADVDER